MIVITGSEGFIGSCLTASLNAAGYYDLILVDDFDSWPGRNLNLIGKKFSGKVERTQFFGWLVANQNQVQFIFHIGARTDTTETNESIFQELNIDFTQKLWQQCVQYGLPLLYASSAATYGNGEYGYNDIETALDRLRPLNAYGRSKHEIDKWAVAQADKPFFWAGLKFFNVYGPNEYHKGRMASVVWHGYKQISETGSMRLFKSYRHDFEHGEQQRDFIYVKDLCDVCIHLMITRTHSGLYNLGSGQARNWNDLAKSIFAAMQKPVSIEYIDMPEDIRDNYQYYTQANMEKLKQTGYHKPFTTIENGVFDYVNHYLIPDLYY
jgi:ADP-L-glycero-D-manno-heptose 6-epimerase